MSRVAFIQSLWHKEIVDQFRDAFTKEMAGSVSIDYFEVPGVVEVPLIARLCAKRQDIDAIVVAGLIVDHGVYRHEFVAQSVLDACLAVQRDFEKPVIYGLLTPQDFMSEGREAFFHEHFVTKGREAASACRLTLANLQRLQQPAGGAEAVTAACV